MPQLNSLSDHLPLLNDEAAFRNLDSTFELTRKRNFFFYITHGNTVIAALFGGSHV